MWKKCMFSLVTCGLLLAGVTPAVEPTGKVPPGSRIFIDNMSTTMAGYVAGEMTKRKLPLTITRDREKADFILDGQMEMHDRNLLYEVGLELYGTELESRGSAMLYDRKTKDVVWSGNAGGRSARLGDNKSERRVAGRLVKQLKKAFFSK
jgi:hypothetical protein